MKRFTVDPFDRRSLHPTGGDKSDGWISINITSWSFTKIYRLARYIKLM